MLVEAFQKQDLKQVESIFKKNVPEFFDAKEWDDFLNYLKENSSTYYILSLDNVIVGAGGYHLVNKNTARLSWDFVNPNFKGKGYGRIIINHCIEKIKQHKEINAITVWTSQHAFKFYQKFGLTTIEIKKNYWSTGLHLYKMEGKIE